MALDPASNPFVPAGAGLENESAFPSGRSERSRRRRSTAHAAQAADEVGQLLRLQTSSTRHAEPEPTARRQGTQRRGTARGSEKTESRRARTSKQRGSGQGPEAGADGTAPGIAAPMQLELDFPALCSDGYKPAPPQVEEAGRRWGAASACSRRDAHETMEQVNIDL